MKIKFGRLFIHLVKETKPLVRRSNGQVARKIPVKYMGKTQEYIYL